MRMTFIYSETPDLATATKHDIWRVHFDFPDTALQLPDHQARLTAIAESVGQLTGASLYVVCDALEWKQKQIHEHGDRNQYGVF